MLVILFPRRSVGSHRNGLQRMNSTSLRALNSRMANEGIFREMHIFRAPQARIAAVAERVRH
jgi:hypothetical protein